MEVGNVVVNKNNVTMRNIKKDGSLSTREFHRDILGGWDNNLYSIPEFGRVHSINNDGTILVHLIKRSMFGYKTDVDSLEVVDIDWWKNRIDEDIMKCRQKMKNLRELSSDLKSNKRILPLSFEEIEYKFHEMYKKVK